MPWTLAAGIALVSFTGTFVIIGRLAGRLEPMLLTMWLLGLQAVLACAHVLPQGRKIVPPANAWLFLLAATGLCYVGNLAQTQAIQTAPNPGFPLAIIGCSTAATTIVATLALGSPLGLPQILGIALNITGVSLIIRCRCP